MKKVMTPATTPITTPILLPISTTAPQRVISADKDLKQPSIISLIISATTIMVASLLTSTISIVLITSIGEVNRQINTAAIGSFFDLIATIFFTMLNVIAAGADSVQTGLMVGIYAGVTLSVLYLVYSWLFVHKDRQIVPTWRRG